MSLVSTFGKNLPRAYGGCTCICHRQEGVMHIMACCSIRDEQEQEQPAIYVVEGENRKSDDNKEECDKV
jgi:hypothetical protein